MVNGDIWDRSREGFILEAALAKDRRHIGPTNKFNPNKLSRRSE